MITPSGVHRDPVEATILLELKFTMFILKLFGYPIFIRNFGPMCDICLAISPDCRMRDARNSH